MDCTVHVLRKFRLQSPDQLTQNVIYPKYLLAVSEKKKILILDIFSLLLMSFQQIFKRKKTYLPTWEIMSSRVRERKKK